MIKTVCIIDDDADDLTLLKKHLHQADSNLEIDTYGSLEEFQQFIADGHDVNKYDAYFIDYLIGPSTGLDVLSALKQSHIEKPVCVVSGVESGVTVASCFRQGATDYLSKYGVTVKTVKEVLDHLEEKDAALMAKGA